MISIKICGVTDAETALQAASLGANYIGLVFCPHSPRSVSIETAIEITTVAREMGANVVAVFTEHDAKTMEMICEQTGIRIAQLHGEVSRREHTNLPEHIARIYVYEIEDHEEITSSVATGLKVERDFLLYDKANKKSNTVIVLRDPGHEFRFFLAGNLSNKNVSTLIHEKNPFGVDVSRSMEIGGKKDLELIRNFINTVRRQQTYYGDFGGCFLPESLMMAIQELTTAFDTFCQSPTFMNEFHELLTRYAARPTPLTEVPRFREHCGGPRLFLKREDCLHTGAHKINNALGQCLLAKKMGKTRVIAETGAGQHGLATATACARLGLDCVIYMGAVDIARQAPNVRKMELLGATVISVETGSKTLKDAVNAAIRDWSETFPTTHYCLGSALGPAPYPKMVATFQAVIGQETKQQCQEYLGKNPDLIIACVGGGSNAIGIFQAFLNDDVKLIGVEAGGLGDNTGEHAARFLSGKPGVLHGCYSYILQDPQGQVLPTHSISAGLDYPMIGPQHAYLFQSERVHYTRVYDEEVIVAVKLLAKTEGIIPAFESAHALAYYQKIAKKYDPKAIVVINLSGRGDKDLERGVV